MGVVTGMLGAILKCFLKNISTCLAFFMVLLIVKLYIKSKTGKRLPPGPWGVPVFGFLPFLGTAMHETLDKLSKKYGPVMQFKLGSKNILVLSEPELIRQTFRREEFTGRPNNKLYDMFQGYGVINIAGDRWKQQRRFLHEHLRAIGMKAFGPGREQMESRIMAEAENLIKSLNSHEGKAINVEQYLKTTSANVIFSMIMSVTFQKDNPVLQRFMKLHKEGFQLFMTADIANYIPLYNYSPTIQSSMKQLRKNWEESISLMKSFVNERKENFDRSRTRDIIDAYLQQEYSAKFAEKNDDKDYDCQLLQVMCDLFSAGQETASLCLQWSFIYLLHNKDVQAKVQEELDSVVGRDRLPSLDDMPYLPYTEATIYEVLRVANIIPLGTPHSTTKDTYVGEYFVPAGTTVFSNLYSCHMNPDLWVNPEVFNPSRFLNEEGKLVKPKHFMPFGVGRRMCLGEVLARSTLFLLITSVLHLFEIDSPEERPLPSLKGLSGTLTAPELFKIKFIARENSVMSKPNILNCQRTRGL